MNEQMGFWEGAGVDDDQLGGRGLTDERTDSISRVLTSWDEWCKLNKYGSVSGLTHDTDSVGIYKVGSPEASILS